MNDAMYEHAATQANLADAARARRRGARARRRARWARRGSGEWAGCPSRRELLAAVEARAGPRRRRALDGLRVLVTAGGTREPIDAVRFLGNRSSGRMGFALAARGGRAAAPRSR